jgi:hypothetical protein
MGSAQSTQKINFEDVQKVCKKPEIYLLISTLPETKQECLIINTIPALQEEQLMNTYLQKNKKIRIIIYGMNSNDDSIYTKYTQLTKLGFQQVYLYPGGLFEWFMLQDIYGYDEFPTTKKELDFLKFKPTSRLNTYLIEN